MPQLLVVYIVIIELRIILEKRGINQEYNIIYSKGPASIEVGTIVIGIVIIGVIAYRGRNSRSPTSTFLNSSRLVIQIFNSYCS